MGYRNQITGTITADEGAVALPLRYHQATQVAVQLTGTFVATLTFEATLDGTTWYAIALNAVATPAVSSIVTTATAVGYFQGDAACAQQFRVRASAFTSGSIGVIIVALPK